MNFDQLLARAAEPTLQTLVGHSSVRLLARLDGGLTQPDRLRDVLTSLRTPQDMLFDPAARRELLALLPVSDARALAASLRLDDDDPFAALDGMTVRRGTARADALLAFFGLTETEPTAPATAATVERVTPVHALFAHQRLAAVRVVGALESEPHRVLLHMPTGSGKTRTAMHVVARFMTTHEPMLVVWLAHSEELGEQACEEFHEAWHALGNRPVTIHRWWGGHELSGEGLADGLLVAGLAKAHSAARRSVETIGAIAGRVGLVVMDEAHQAVAPTYQQVLEALTESGDMTPLLGLSATPGRTWNDIDEDARLAEFFYRRKVPLEVPGFDSPIDYLVHEGYLARTTFSSLTYDGGIELGPRDQQELADALDIPEKLIARLADHEQRNLVILNEVERMVRTHRRLLVFAATVGHAVVLATVLRARGVDAQAVTGETPAEVRARRIADYRAEDDDARVLVNFGVLTTGFDAPRTSAAIIARPTMSLVLYSQMVGRATRGVRAGGNAEAEVVTVVDTALPGFASLVEAFHNWEDVWRQTP